MKQEEIRAEILSKKVAIEICLHMPEKVEQLEREILEREGLLNGN